MWGQMAVIEAKDGQNGRNWGQKTVKMAVFDVKYDRFLMSEKWRISEKPIIFYGPKSEDFYELRIQ